MYIYLNTIRKTIIAATSILLFIATFFLSYKIFIAFYRPSVIFKEITKALYFPVFNGLNYAITLGLIASLIPYASIDFLNRRYINSLEKSVPLYLRDVSDGIRSGMTLIESLESSARREYGALNKEMRRILAKVYLGKTLEDAFKDTMGYLNSELFNKFAYTIILAFESGGERVIEILEGASKIFGEIQEFKSDRKTEIKPYVSTIYISLILFIFMVFIIVESFLRPISIIAARQRTIGGILDISLYYSLLYNLSVIESIAGGLLIGKMNEGKSSAGLVHILILLVMTLLSFSILFPLLRKFIKF